jgi:RimJ/RimL family protein N-acetyltransferase
MPDLRRGVTPLILGCRIKQGDNLLKKENIAMDLRLPPYRNMLIGSDVFLRPIFPTDAPGLFPIYTDPKKMQYFGFRGRFTEEQILESTATKAKNALDFYNLPKDFFDKKGIMLHLAFFNHKGFSGVIMVSNPTDKEYADCLEIGYCGQGGTSKAARLVLNFLYVSFIAKVHPEHVVSQKILEALGFKQELHKQGVVIEGKSRNYYKLTRTKPP